MIIKQKLKKVSKQKNYKKHGFTLVELLATIVILGIVMLIGINAIMPIVKKIKIKSFETKTLTFMKEAKKLASSENITSPTLYGIDKLGNENDNIKGFVFVTNEETGLKSYIYVCDKELERCVGNYIYSEQKYIFKDNNESNEDETYIIYDENADIPEKLLAGGNTYGYAGSNNTFEKIQQTVLIGSIISESKENQFTNSYQILGQNGYEVTAFVLSKNEQNKDSYVIDQSTGNIPEYYLSAEDIYKYETGYTYDSSKYSTFCSGKECTTAYDFYNSYYKLNNSALINNDTVNKLGITTYMEYFNISSITIKIDSSKINNVSNIKKRYCLTVKKSQIENSESYQYTSKFNLCGTIVDYGLIKKRISNDNISYDEDYGYIFNESTSQSA